MATKASDSKPPSNLTATSPTRTLVSLPLEIKTRIYEFVFGEARLEIRTDRPSPAGRRPDIYHPSVVYHNGNRAVTQVSKQVRQEARPIFLARTVIVIRSGAAMQYLEQSITQPEIFTKARTVELKMGTGSNNSRTWPWFAGCSNLRTLCIEYYRGIELSWTVYRTLETRLAQYNGDMCKLVEQEGYDFNGLASLRQALGLPERANVNAKIMIYSASFNLAHTPVAVRFHPSQFELERMLIFAALDRRSGEEDLQEICHSDG